MAEQKAPAKGNAGDNIEQFGYKQELRRGMGLWDVVMYGVLSWSSSPRNPSSAPFSRTATA